jgi:dolichyl-diphosphooligosaccharide--protein glycosyltransferase
MDDTVYDSMMVRMLLGDPGAFGEWFELVEDRFPWNRVYRVK